MNQLEQMVEFAPRATTRSIDTYASGTAALYTPPPMQFNPIISGMGGGMMHQTTLNDYGFRELRPVEPLRIYELPSGVQFHVHNDAEESHLKLGTDYLSPKLNAYESAMGDLYASNLNFKMIDTVSRKRSL